MADVAPGRTRRSRGVPSRGAGWTAVALALLVPVACNDTPDEAEEMPPPDEPALQEAPVSPDADELAAQDLTLDRVERWTRVQVSFMEAQAGDPELQARVEQRLDQLELGPDGALTLEDEVEVIRSEPAYEAAVEGEGFDVREFAAFGRTFTAAHTAHQMRAEGQPPEMYEQAWPWLQEEHVAFIEENEEEVEAILDQYREAMQPTQ